MKTIVCAMCKGTGQLRRRSWWPWNTVLCRLCGGLGHHRVGGLTEQALAMVAGERRSQDARWKREPGVWDRPAGVKALVLGEEYGEVCNAVLERAPDTELLSELIQTAAVATAWAEVILAGNRADGVHKG